MAFRRMDITAIHTLKVPLPSSLYLHFKSSERPLESGTDPRLMVINSAQCQITLQKIDAERIFYTKNPLPARKISFSRSGP